MALKVTEEQKEIFKALKKRTQSISKNKKVGNTKQISVIINDIHKKYIKKHKQATKEAQNEIHKKKLPRAKR